MTARVSEPFTPVRLTLFHFVKLAGPSLKIQLDENPDYDKVIARYKNMKVNWESFAMKVLPINSSQEHKTVLSKCKMLLDV